MRRYWGTAAWPCGRVPSWGVTSEDDADLFEAIKSGAQGFLPKNVESDQFFALLEGVSRGERRPPAALAPEQQGVPGRQPERGAVSRRVSSR